MICKRNKVALTTAIRATCHIRSWEMSYILHMQILLTSSLYMAHCNSCIFTVLMEDRCAFTRRGTDKQTLTCTFDFFLSTPLQNQHPQIHHLTFPQMCCSKAKRKTYHFSCDGTHPEVITNTRQPVPKRYPFCQSSHKIHPWHNTTNVPLLPNCEKAIKQ